MTTIDSGDDISYDGIVHRVACNHDGYVRLMGHPEIVVHESLCKLLHKATEAQRIDLLTALAESTWSNHRNVCAREKLAAMATADWSAC